MRLAPSRPYTLPLVIRVLILAAVILAQWIIPARVPQLAEHWLIMLPALAASALLLPQPWAVAVGIALAVRLPVVALLRHQPVLPSDLILAGFATALAVWFISVLSSRHHGLAFLKAVAHEHGQLACVIDRNGIITYMNDAGVEMLGHRTAEELVGRHYETFVPAWCRARASELVQAALDGQHPVGAICTVLHASGEAVTLRLDMRLLQHRARRHVVCFADDITEPVRIERLLSASFNADSLPSAIVAVDGTVIICNGAFAAAMAMPKSDVVGRRCLPFGLDPALPLQWHERLSAGHAIHAELESTSERTLAVEVHPIPEETGAVTAYSIRLRDVTEQKVGAERMVQAAKFAAVGQVAAGVAHNINNILAAIAVSAELLQYDPEQLGARASQDILNAVDRGAVMVKQLYDLSGGNATPRLELLNVAQLLSNELEVVGPQLSQHNIAARIEVDDSLEVNADASLLRQVLMNLVINSIQAMPEGGCLTLAARSVGQLVELSVSDTGSGIPPQHLDQIFTPFFTTKASANGTGLGLPTSLRMARAMGGNILVRNLPGGGTAFTVQLPGPISGAHRQQGI